MTCFREEKIRYRVENTGGIRKEMVNGKLNSYRMTSKSARWGTGQFSASKGAEEIFHSFFLFRGETCPFRKKHHVVNTGEVAPVFKGRNSNDL